MHLEFILRGWWNLTGSSKIVSIRSGTFLNINQLYQTHLSLTLRQISSAFDVDISLRDIPFPSLIPGCPSNYVPLDRTCVQVVIAARKGEFPVSWDEARAGCRERGGELVSLSPPELLVAVSKHIETTWPGEANSV